MREYYYFLVASRANYYTAINYATAIAMRKIGNLMIHKMHLRNENRLYITYFALKNILATRKLVAVE